MVLRQLLHPYSVAEFFDQIWEQRHLHISRDENPTLQEQLSDLLTIDDVDRLLTTTYAAEPRRWDSIRMGRGGVMIAPEEFLARRDGGLADVDVDRVLALHRNGASIILNSVHATVEPVAELCRAISRFVGVGVHANIYVTPRQAQGFPRHFDPHDVFLLQLVGEKHWRVAPSVVPLATAEARDESHLVPQGPQSRICLRRGELLYVPRGLLHEGETSDDCSVHLTIGMNPYTWAQLLHDVVTELEDEDVEFRRSVPARLLGSSVPVPAGDPSPRFAAALATLTGRLNDTVRAGRVAERVAEAFRGPGREPRRGQLRQIHETERVDLDTSVQLREHVNPDIRRNGGDVTVIFGDSRLTMPAFTEPHLAALCAGAPIRGADLPATLDDSGKLVLVRRLVREGLLVPAAGGEAANGGSRLSPVPGPGGSRR